MRKTRAAIPSLMWTGPSPCAVLVAHVRRVASGPAEAQDKIAPLQPIDAPQGFPYARVGLQRPKPVAQRHRCHWAGLSRQRARCAKPWCWLARDKRNPRPLSFAYATPGTGKDLQKLFASKHRQQTGSAPATVGPAARVSVELSPSEAANELRRRAARQANATEWFRQCAAKVILDFASSDPDTLRIECVRDARLWPGRRL